VRGECRVRSLGCGLEQAQELVEVERSRAPSALAWLAHAAPASWVAVDPVTVLGLVEDLGQRP
jgi:hypothetical protein